MNEFNLEEHIAKMAAAEGMSVERFLQRAQERIQLLETPLLPQRRLETIEGLARRGIIGGNYLDLLLRKNPIFSTEIIDLTSGIAEVFENILGWPNPQYSILTDERFDPTNVLGCLGITDWTARTITLPTHAGMLLPLVSAHEIGHAYHMENGRLWWTLKGALKKDPKEYRTRRENASLLIDGWAQLIALLHARQRDADVRQKIYEPRFRETVGFQELLDKNGNTNIRRGYYAGLALFEQIYEHEGIAGAVQVAREFTTDEELLSYTTLEKR